MPKGEGGWGKVMHSATPAMPQYTRANHIPSQAHMMREACAARSLPAHGQHINNAHDMANPTNVCTVF